MDSIGKRIVKKKSKKYIILSTKKGSHQLKKGKELSFSRVTEKCVAF